MEKKNYSYDEAYGESLKYFQGDELAARVWVNKYAVKDSFGNIYEKSPEDMQFVLENNKETLAQVFTDVRYTKKDNEAMSENLWKVMKEQGF